MRNLREYPITQQERVAVLSTLRDALMAEGGIGDIRPAVLSNVIAMLDRLEAAEARVKELEAVLDEIANTDPMVGGSRHRKPELETEGAET